MKSREGSSGFSWYSTAEEVTQGIDGRGLIAIVTGSNSGIGRETTRVLAMRGVHVVMGVRKMNCGKKVKEEILREIPSAKLDVMELNLSSFSSIRKFASDFNQSGLNLNILINNAGVTGIPFTLSEDKIEAQFATNYLGHFLLTNLFLETMKRTSRESGIEGRIVNVASTMHNFAKFYGGIDFNRINDPSVYSSNRAYVQSKLANVLHANELARRLTEEGSLITANSLHPGTILTNIFRHQNFLTRGFVNVFFRFVLKSIQQGAATTCYVALHPQVKGLSGEYFDDSRLSEASPMGRDTALAKELWDFSLNITSS